MADAAPSRTTTDAVQLIEDSAGARKLQIRSFETPVFTPNQLIPSNQLFLSLFCFARTSYSARHLEPWED